MEQNTEKQASKPVLYRKERKFTVSDVDVSSVKFFIKSHPAQFSEPYPPRFVNNIYFDYPEFLNYNENVVGSASRNKFRLRWYGKQFGLIEKPVLEIKIKKGWAGTKQNFKLVPFTFEPGFTQKTLDAVFEQSDLPNEIRELVKFQSPTLLNQYHRTYYVSKDEKFRLTLDHKLRYGKIGRFQNSFLHQVTIDNEIILELKYDTELDEEAHKISDSFPFRLNRNSKYVIGIDSLDAH